MEHAAVAMPGVMPGVKLQVIGVHSGDLVASPYRMSVDNRDCRPNNPSDTAHQFVCKDLVHFTENESAETIGLLEDEGNADQHFKFRAFPWRTSDTEEFRLSWWSPLRPDNWRDILNADIPNVFIDYKNIGNSVAVEGDSLCGPIGFVVPWADILGQYAISRKGSLDDIQLRNLGTYRYTKEIMYSVFVCLKGDFEVDDKRFPLITSDNETEAFALLTNEFIWKVYSTIGYSKPRPAASNVLWSWDHLAFGFYCPSKSDLNIKHKFCRITDKLAKPQRPSSRQITKLRSSLEQIPDPAIITALNDKIQNAPRI